MTRTSEPSAKDREWVMRAYDAIPAAPVRRAASSRGVDPVMSLAEAVRGQLKKRDAAIAELRRDITALRHDLDTARKLDEIMNRLDRLEAPRGSLRAVT